MATDNSPPKIRIILTVAFSSAVILVTLNYVFRSYFEMMRDEVELAHQRTPEDLIKLHEGEKRNLASSPMPIERAMQEVAAKGREASPDIAAQPSNDLGPMVGWIRNPNQAVIDAINAAANSDAGAAPAVAGDGGAAPAAAGDAGAPASDAGARQGAADAGAKPKH
jgi:hypothetical protein